MSMPAPLQLDPAEIVPGRPFTAPELIAADFAVLERIKATLQATLRAMPESHRSGDIVFPHEPDGRGHRVVVLDRATLLKSQEPFAVVGFFGQRRPAAAHEEMDALDAELIDELRSHPHMLSYSSRELPCGGWANLVLLADPEGTRRWRESRRHAYAARQIAPGYYNTVRIHNAALPVGLASHALVHVRTLYYDFSGGPWWHAVRPAFAARA